MTLTLVTTLVALLTIAGLVGFVARDRAEVIFGAV